MLECENDVYLYADNMLILSSHLNVNNMLKELQQKMDILSSWCMLNKLTINESKTKYYMIVGPNHYESLEILSIGKNIIGKVKQYEYLGMIVDHKTYG